MVVLSASVCTKNGRCLFARQFVEMNRLRVEGLLAAFPKLMGTGNKQHTFIETDSVRYVWQPVESIYLLLITNKASNIVEDLETLRLLSKVVPEIAGGHSEEKLSDKAFDLVFAFDEVITTGGYREAIDLRQIRTNLEMDSHEEKLHNMVKKTKMDSAKDQAAHMSKVIKSRQREASKSGVGPGGMAGLGGGSFEDDPYGGGGGDFGGGMGMPAPPMGGESPYGESPYGAPAPPPEPVVQVKSMKLGGKKNKSSLMDKMAAEDGISIAPAFTPSKPASSSAAPPPPPPTAAQPISLIVEEKLTVALSQEGALESFDLKGTLSLTANDEGAALCKVQIADKAAAPGTTFQVHPKVSKKDWEADGAVMMKDASKGFPVGRPVGVVRWGDGVMNVNVEYELKRPMELYDVVIRIPGCGNAPEIVSVDGSHTHDAKEEVLDWKLDMVDGSNKQGTLEFNINARDADDFFPIAVTFRSKSLYYDAPIASVTAIDGDAPVAYSLNKALTVDSFRIA
ncbi:hypothetical protein JL720_350 [Aureococcus anophagefferens]|nr:hypothetical protein JL720_350 [Aureococcus anophagefferens]